MCGTTQETLAHHHIRRKICNGIGRKVVELRPEKVQETSEEWVRGQRETSLHMGGEEDPLAFARLWLSFFPRQPPRVGGNQAVGGEILEILLRDRRGQKVALDPTRRRHGPGARRLLPLGSLLGLRYRGGGRRGGAELRALRRRRQRKGGNGGGALF